MANTPGNIYADPAGGSESSIGNQLRTDYYYKKALVDAAKASYFSPLASVRGMPKNMGKTIKQFHYLPLLDDRNLNDQGIDANGLVGGVNGAVAQVTVIATLPSGRDLYFVGEDNNATYTTAVTAATSEVEAKVISHLLQEGFNTAADSYAELTAAAIVEGWLFAAAVSHADSGNLYGSSKDVGTIAGKMPALGENGGRVNRVGTKRIQLEGSINKFGFFDEYNKESLDFDTDPELEGHIISETVKAANEITEDQLQIDLLNSAGVVRYTGDAVSTATLNGGVTVGAGDAVTYDDFVKLGIELDNNLTPKDTQVITGSKLTDTRVINSARYMYIGSEMQVSIMKMKDYHDNQAFIPIAAYGAAGSIARGEIGSVGDFRIIVVPEMMKWENAGATVADPDGGEKFRWTGTNYDVFPMLVVGDQSFVTIGFQTDGKTVKFKIKHIKPESDQAYSRDDPFGETGFYSIKWYYGIMILRSERIAVIKTVAEI